MSVAAHARFWARTKKLTVWLLAAWLLVNLLAPWFARELNTFKLWGFPLGFWIAAQGGLIAYLVIIVVYVWRMDRLEAGYLDETSPGAAPTALDSGPRT